MAAFMNDYDIAEAQRRFLYAGVQNLGDASDRLAELAEWADDNSDGWAYWAKPRNAAARLIDLIQSADRFDPVDVTAADVSKALRPVKAFLTRQGVEWGDVLQEA